MSPALYEALMDRCVCERSWVEKEDQLPILVLWRRDPACPEIHVTRA